MPVLQSKRLLAACSRLLPISFCAALLIGTAAPSTTLYAAAPHDQIDDQIARMTLEQRIGQLFIIRFWGKVDNDSVQALIDTIHPGGAVLVPDNISDPVQVSALTSSLQTRSVASDGVPLLITTDQEGGRVQRLQNGFTRLPRPLVLGAATAPVVSDYGRMVGTELQAVGLNMDLAPVVDLDTTPNSSLLQGRTFGDNPQQTGQTVAAFIDGMRQANVVTAAKHFPGHGDAADSHDDTSYLNYDLARLRSVEMVPFQLANAPIILISHLTVPALDPDRIPSSLSPKVVQYLRGPLGYDGVLMTDALDMRSISRYYTYADASIRAISAGVDLVLLGSYTLNNQQIGAYQATVAAVRSGKIPEATINAAVRRILTLKQTYHILDWQPPTAADAPARIAAAQGDAVLQTVYNAAVTVVRNTNGLLPIRADQRVLLIVPKVYPTLLQSCQQHIGTLTTALTSYGSDLPVLSYEPGEAAALARKADVVIAFTDDAQHDSSQRTLIQNLPAAKTIVVALSSPYDLKGFPAIGAYVLAYNPLDPAFNAACAVIAGQQPAPGILPIRLLSEAIAGENAARKALPTF